MLITEEVTIKIVSKNKNYYNDLGYGVKFGDIIKIPISKLPINSKIKIKIKCDICGNEKNTSYKNYNIQHKKYDFDS